jgi:Helix-turn-helix domain
VPHCRLRARLERPQPPGASTTTGGRITRAFLEVLEALLWGFHNSRSGVCFPSYEAIAAKAECARSTVAEAIKVLEWAGVLTWQHRITRILVRERDLLGQWASRWQVIRTSNAYVFRDPKSGLPCGFPCKSENPTGTLDQEVLSLERAPAPDPNSHWSELCDSSVPGSKKDCS